VFGNQKLNRTPAEYSKNIGRLYRIWEISVKSTGQPFHEPTLWQEATPANPSALLDADAVNTIPDTYGQCSPTVFAWFDPDTQFWKTSQGTLLWDSEMSRPIWPRSGMTRNGTAYQQLPSAHRTTVTEYSSSLHDVTWSTPTRMMVEHPWEQLRQDGNDIVRMDHNGNRWSAGLANEVRWRTGDPSTPTGQLNPTWVEWLMGFPIGWTDLED